MLARTHPSERTMYTKNLQRLKVFSQVFFKKLAGFGAEPRIKSIYKLFHSSFKSRGRKLRIADFILIIDIDIENKGFR